MSIYSEVSLKEREKKVEKHVWKEKIKPKPHMEKQYDYEYQANDHHLNIEQHPNG